MATLDDFYRLGLALAIGLLIGLERGWQERAAPEGSRVAGLRTIGLIGLLGGVLGLLAGNYGAIILAGGLIALAVPLGIGYWLEARKDSDLSATTIFAALLAAALGALATTGYPRLSVSAAVIAALLLDLKPALHGMVARIEPVEIKAILRFLLISVVLLPLLPNEGFGPYGGLNPYIIWWMVVLVSGISFAGYIAVRLWGEKRGLLLTAAVGALVSSTAITLAFSREARKRPASSRLLASGIILASSIMVVRMTAVAALIAPALMPGLLLYLSPIAVAGFAASIYLTPKEHQVANPDYRLDNPFDLRVALFFGFGLGVIMLLARYLESRYGSSGLYSVALLTGLFDVDAMTVSASQMVHGGLDPKTASVAISLAAISNSLTKAVIGIVIGGRAILAAVLISFALMAAAGVAAILMQGLN